MTTMLRQTGKKRFQEYLDDKANGKDPGKVRIVLE